MKVSRPLARTRAFTLIELLIVIGLSGFIFMTLMTVYMQIKKLSYDQTRVSSQSAAVIEFGTALSYDLENLIFEKFNVRQVFLVKKEEHGGKRFDAFVFPSASLNANPSVLQARSFMVSYFIEPDKNSSTFTLYRAEDMYLDAKHLFQGVAVPLVHMVEEFRVDCSMNGIDFEEEWDYKSRRQMPRYIKATIRYRQSENSNETMEYVVETRPPILWN